MAESPEADKDQLREKEIIPKLIEKGFLDLTIPGKPRSPNKKYVLTEAGRKRLEESESIKT